MLLYELPTNFYNHCSIQVQHRCWSPRMRKICFPPLHEDEIFYFPSCCLPAKCWMLHTFPGICPLLSSSNQQLLLTCTCVHQRHGNASIWANPFSRRNFDEAQFCLSPSPQGCVITLQFSQHLLVRAVLISRPKGSKIQLRLSSSPLSLSSPS